MSFGVFVLEVMEYDHGSLLSLPAEPFGFAPLRVTWRMRLIASRESVSVDGSVRRLAALPWRSDDGPVG